MNGSAVSIGPTVDTMSSSDRSGPTASNIVGPGDAAKVVGKGTLRAPTRLAGWLIDRPRWQPGADPEMEPAPPLASDAPGRG
jgi:hypothetical protein